MTSPESRLVGLPYSIDCGACDRRGHNQQGSAHLVFETGNFVSAHRERQTGYGFSIADRHQRLRCEREFCSCFDKDMSARLASLLFQRSEDSSSPCTTNIKSNLRNKSQTLNASKELAATIHCNLLQDGTIERRSSHFHIKRLEVEVLHQRYAIVISTMF